MDQSFIDKTRAEYMKDHIFPTSTSDQSVLVADQEVNDVVMNQKGENVS